MIAFTIFDFVVENLVNPPSFHVTVARVCKKRELVRVVRVRMFVVDVVVLTVLETDLKRSKMTLKNTQRARKFVSFDDGCSSFVLIL